MKNLLTLGLLFGARLASANQGVCQLSTGTDCTSTAPPLVSAPSGMGQYCSKTWSTGGWTFDSHTDLNGDPCDNGSTGGTIQRSGMYAVDGMNSVVMRCDDGRIALRVGMGNDPLTSAYNDGQGRPGCIFTVSPQAFPVFRSPFSLSTLPEGYSHNTGFDFARYPYTTVDLLHDFQVPGGRPKVFILDYLGEQKDGSVVTTLTSGSSGDVLPTSPLHLGSTSGFPSSGTALVETVDAGPQSVSYTGKTSTTLTGVTGGAGTLATGDQVAASYGFINDHSGHDFNMADGATIFAVADGVVDMKRFRNVANLGASCQNGAGQGEIYIRHRFSGGKAQYDEVYESYYAHLSTISVSTGQIVHKGDAIGTSGHSGCTGGTPHLHFGVMRLLNTASARSFPLIINTNFGVATNDQNSDLGYRQLVEPYGFFPPTAPAFDPWGWRANDASLTCYDSARGSVPCDWGALSPKLWTSGQQPPLAPSGDLVVW